MPLVERYGDWTTNDGSYRDPRTLEFDHRLTVDEETLGGGEGGLAGLRHNAQATCLITTLDESYGWSKVDGGGWLYNPSESDVQSIPTLGAHFERNVPSCIEYDRNLILDTLLPKQEPSKKVTSSQFKHALQGMTWPADGSDSRGTTSFISRFPIEGEYISGAEWASGYHLGDGIVATAGHCLAARLLNNTLHTMKVVFGWSGNVRAKRFSADQVFDIEKVMICDAPGEYRKTTDSHSISKWDNAVFKLKGATDRFQLLKKVELSSQPPRFGTPLYNAGHPLGTTMKISRDSHVLRHAPFNGHNINSGGTYSTDLDQFSGNSGGPVFDSLTAQVVGHTVSTQSAVSEFSITDIEVWEKESLVNSENYKIARDIVNPHLLRKYPQDSSYRFHPKFHRTLSGKPGGGALFLNTTFVCPGDVGPNGIPQRPDTYQAVFNRHHWDSPDVYLRNLTGRIDRIYIFTRSLIEIVAEFPNSVLIVTLTGNPTTFQKPPLGSTISITIGSAEWRIDLSNIVESTDDPQSSISYSLSLNLSHSVSQSHIPPSCLSSSFSLTSWASIRLSQPTSNPPHRINLELIIRRDTFPFPVNKSWPPNRPDVTNDPKDEELEWPAEEFRFVTTVGNSDEATQRDEGRPAEPVMKSEGGRFEWVAGIDRVWRDPRQGLGG